MGFHGVLSGCWFWQFTSTFTATHFKSMVISTKHPKYGWKTMIEPQPAIQIGKPLLKNWGLLIQGWHFSTNPPGCWSNVLFFWGENLLVDQAGFANPGLKWYDLCQSRTYFERHVIFNYKLSFIAFTRRDVTLDSVKSIQRLGQTWRANEIGHVDAFFILNNQTLQFGGWSNLTLYLYQINFYPYPWIPPKLA